MKRAKGKILRAKAIQASLVWAKQDLNRRRNTTFQAKALARKCGLERTGLNYIVVPPGGESFAYHSHQAEEEWVYILEGRGRLRMDGKVYDVRPGDFVGYPTPSVAHILTNPYSTPLIYLTGGENRPIDVLEYPDIKETHLLSFAEGRSTFYKLAKPKHPFHVMKKR